jgi:hypothetical protein
MAEGSRKLHNEDFHNLYPAQIVIRMAKSRKMRRSTNREEYSILLLLVGKSERRRPLEKPICWRVNNIKMELAEIRWSGMELTDMLEDRDQCRTFVKTVMNLQFP